MKISFIFSLIYHTNFIVGPLTYSERYAGFFHDMKGYAGPPLDLISFFDREGRRTPIPPHLVSPIKTTQSCS